MDRNGYTLTDYPESHISGRLLGITNEGVAAYHRDQEIFLAEMTGQGIQSPPEGYGLTHEVDLKAWDWTVGTYLIETARDEGPWRAVTEYATSKLPKDVAESDIVTPSPD